MIQRLNQAIIYLEKEQHELLFNALLLELLINVQRFFTELNDYMESLSQSKDVLNQAKLGHLVPMKCGHRGKPNRSEEKLIENLLM